MFIFLPCNTVASALPADEVKLLYWLSTVSNIIPPVFALFFMGSTNKLRNYLTVLGIFLISLYLRFIINFFIGAFDLEVSDNYAIQVHVPIAISYLIAMAVCIIWRPHRR